MKRLSLPGQKITCTNNIILAVLHLVSCIFGFHKELYLIVRVWHIHMAPVIAVDLENVRYDQCGYHEFHTVHRSDVQFRVKLPIK